MTLFLIFTGMWFFCGFKDAFKMLLYFGSILIFGWYSILIIPVLWFVFLFIDAFTGSV